MTKSSRTSSKDEVLMLVLMLADFIYSHTHQEQPNDEVVDEVGAIAAAAARLRHDRLHGEKVGIYGGPLQSKPREPGTSNEK